MSIVITGMGTVCCAGSHVTQLASALWEGRSGLSALDSDWNGLPGGAVVGRVKEVPIDGGPRGAHLLNRAIDQALQHASLPRDSGRGACFIGSVHGHLDQWKTQGSQCADAVMAWDDVPDSVLRYFGRPLPTTAVSTACTSSAVAIGLALDALRSRRYDYAIVGGFEAMTDFLYRGFVALRSLDSQCRPFDTRRAGTVLGEGAGALVLEQDAYRALRDVAPLTEVAGFGMATDSFGLTAPEPTGQGAASALSHSMIDAGMYCTPDVVNVHGTGTRLNDQMEYAALRRVFGEALPRIPIAATKPIIGHTCGAAGVLEVIALTIGMRSGVIPPLPVGHEKDEAFADLDFPVAHARRRRQKWGISMNSGFGGSNTAIVLKSIGDV